MNGRPQAMRPKPRKVATLIEILVAKKKVARMPSKSPAPYRRLSRGANTPVTATVSTMNCWARVPAMRVMSDRGQAHKHGDDYGIRLEAQAIRKLSGKG